MKTQITTLFGTNHILWLEGSRLAANGFTVGTAYTQVWKDDCIVCVLGDYNGDGKAFPRKVNNQDGNPAIRIEGEKIRKLFAGFKNLKVVYEPHIIVITGNEVAVQFDEPIKEAA